VPVQIKFISIWWRKIFHQSLVILTTLLHHQQQQLKKHALQLAQLIYINAFYASSVEY
jgi:hypothetical protein